MDGIVNLTDTYYIQPDWKFIGILLCSCEFEPTLLFSKNRIHFKMIGCKTNKVCLNWMVVLKTLPFTVTGPWMGGSLFALSVLLTVYDSHELRMFIFEE